MIDPLAVHATEIIDGHRRVVLSAFEETLK
jgi:hypothetical protein